MAGQLARLSTLPNRVQPAASRLATVATPEGQRVDRARESSTQRGYGYRWQQARAGYLRKHPLCVHCEAAGRFTVATDLDHTVPHKGDMVLFWDAGNWQGLCKPCHSVKTASEDGGFGNKREGG